MGRLDWTVSRLPGENNNTLVVSLLAKEQTRFSLSTIGERSRTSSMNTNVLNVDYVVKDDETVVSSNQELKLNYISPVSTDRREDGSTETRHLDPPALTTASIPATSTTVPINSTILPKKAVGGRSSIIGTTKRRERRKVTLSCELMSQSTTKWDGTFRLLDRDELTRSLDTKIDVKDKSKSGNGDSTKPKINKTKKPSARSRFISGPVLLPSNYDNI